jgi:hypothetical protein
LVEHRSENILIDTHNKPNEKDIELRMFQSADRRLLIADGGQSRPSAGLFRCYAARSTAAGRPHCAAAILPRLASAINPTRLFFNK